MPDRFSVALIIDDGKENILLQLRDDKPEITYPNCLGTFGGHSEKGETPDETLKREIAEELDEPFDQMTFWKNFPIKGVDQYVYWTVKGTLSKKAVPVKEGQQSVWVKKNEVDQQPWGWNGNAKEIVTEYFRIFYPKKEL